MVILFKDVLKKDHFARIPIAYENGWKFDDGSLKGVLVDCFASQDDSEAWSSEVEDLHSEATKTGWIDYYERERVVEVFSKILQPDNQDIIVEFGASEGYMSQDLKNEFPQAEFIATDLFRDGLRQSYMRNNDIAHIQCDFTNAPFQDEKIDVIYALNVLEHIEDDVKTIEECFRCLNRGGYCLFVVPRGEKLYDYYDEMLFHKRRYSAGELKKKCQDAGFQVIENFHFAWLCYPAFWLKKKYNQHVGKNLSQEEKLKRVEEDMNNAFSSPLAIGVMHLERKISKVFQPRYGIREFILLRKPE